MKKFIKLFFIIIATLLAVLFFVANFSSAETKYKCTGSIQTENASHEDLTMFLKIQEYRWWVGLWGDSDGALNLEVPNQYVDYYSDLVEVGDQLQIFRDGSIKGNFSKLSKTIALQLHAGFFDGVCEQTP